MASAGSSGMGAPTPVPRGRVGHAQPGSDRPHPTAPDRPGQPRADRLDRVQPPGQQERRQPRMAHPATSAGGPPDPDPPGAAITHPAQIARPKAHRPPAAGAVGPGDLDPAASCRIGIDTKQAGPYDGHGVPTPPWTLPERQLTGEGPLVSRPPDPAALRPRARIHHQSTLPIAQP